jgi:hypothetical protein
MIGLLYVALFLITLVNNASSVTLSDRLMLLEKRADDRKTYPLFEMSKELDDACLSIRDQQSILKANGGVSGENVWTEMDLELLYHRYLDNLNLYYFDLFVKRIEEGDIGGAVVRGEGLKQEILHEFEVAAMKSTPKSDMNGCFYDKHVKELEHDIDDYLRNVYNNSSNQGDNFSPNEDGIDASMGLQSAVDNNNDHRSSRSRWLAFLSLNEKWEKRVTWIVSKLAMLGVNMLQYEWYRRQSIHNSEKRLSEIPEFPVL